MRVLCPLAPWSCRHACSMRGAQHWAGSPGSRPGGLLAPGRPELSKAIYTRTSGHTCGCPHVARYGHVRLCSLCPSGCQLGGTWPAPKDSS